jgi:hypothetical protein
MTANPACPNPRPAARPRGRLRHAAGLPDGGHDRHRALQRTAARGLRSAARQGAAADRTRRTVQARHPAFRAQDEPLSRHHRRTGEHQQYSVSPQALPRPDDGQGQVAPDSRQRRRAHRLDHPEEQAWRAGSTAAGQHEYFHRGRAGDGRHQRSEPAADQSGYAAARQRRPAGGGSGCARYAATGVHPEPPAFAGTPTSRRQACLLGVLRSRECTPVSPASTPPPQSTFWDGVQSGRSLEAFRTIPARTPTRTRAAVCMWRPSMGQTSSRRNPGSPTAIPNQAWIRRPSRRLRRPSGRDSEASQGLCRDAQACFPGSAAMLSSTSPQSGFGQPAPMSGFGGGTDSSSQNANTAVGMNNFGLTNANPQMQPPGLPGMGGTQVGGGIAGVASESTGPAIKSYNERKKYNEWEFVYDQSKDRGLAGVQGNGGAPGTPAGQMGSMPPGMNPQQPGGSGAPFGMGSQGGQGGNARQHLHAIDRRIRPAASPSTSAAAAPQPPNHNQPQATQAGARRAAASSRPRAPAARPCRSNAPPRARPCLPPSVSSCASPRASRSCGPWNMVIRSGIAKLSKTLRWVSGRP